MGTISCWSLRATTATCSSTSSTGAYLLGIEPAANVARAAHERGIDSVVACFGREPAARLVAEGRRADLLVANNVLAHVPDLNDFVAGMERVLAPAGVIEFT
jgi:predicted TPR repeat methyltransferase